MEKRTRLIIGAAMALVLVSGLVGFSIFRVGGFYGKGLQMFEFVPTPGTINNTERKIFKKIRIKKNTGSDCIDVTPDGALRTYDTCGGDVTGAVRPLDSKYILRLFRQLAETDLTPFENKPQTGTYYEIVIDTNQGTVTVYIPTSPNNPVGGGIVETIENVSSGAPTPTLPPGAPSQTPTPTPTLSPGAPTYTPAPSAYPTTVGVSPTPEVDKGFSCDFSQDSTGKHPHDISAVICSSGPTPIP